MSQLLQKDWPYGPRNEATFLAEMNELSRAHIGNCAPYAAIWSGFEGANRLEELPWLHVGVFKQMDFRTTSAGIHHERVLNSSATSGSVASRIALDRASSELQAASSAAILSDFLDETARPLLVLDSSRSLIARGTVSARIAAALSLRPLASDIHFLLAEAENPSSLDWTVLDRLLDSHEELLVYGFTWMLWLALGDCDIPEATLERLSSRRIRFVHSGGWKKLKARTIGPEAFNTQLLSHCGPGSTVTDYYGLVEQVGVIYPLCEAGFRHVPRWANVLVRDAWTLNPLVGETGLLQLMNTLPRGAPYQNVLTEDLGRIEPGTCPCGRSGARFVLEGRVPQAELRGCANV